ncbi:hypothetical protein PAHAL_7G084700 [Panicum hallii]|uniref:Uncharacterized protein n=1 Tax=Panicum hallii TaxID=206008 RepID=A0A2T8IBG4_9POAL|nr:hypothetical protein PAHAL_7G084700 [Panicum hallii]
MVPWRSLRATTAALARPQQRTCCSCFFPVNQGQAPPAPCARRHASCSSCPQAGRGGGRGR